MPESNAIVEQLTRLEVKAESLEETVNDRFSLLSGGVEDRFSHFDRKLEKIQTLLMGDGQDGVVHRFDKRIARLEDSEARRSKLTWAAISASFATIVTVIGAWVKMLLDRPR